MNFWGPCATYFFEWKPKAYFTVLPGKRFALRRTQHLLQRCVNGTASLHRGVVGFSCSIQRRDIEELPAPIWGQLEGGKARTVACAELTAGDLSCFPLFHSLTSQRTAFVTQFSSGLLLVHNWWVIAVHPAQAGGGNWISPSIVCAGGM